jgi:hypothetical protein
MNWRYGPASRDIGDTTYASATHTYSGAGYRPLSPVHIRGTRSEGDLFLTWIRRTRQGGDRWATLDVPLAEVGESFAVDILDGAMVKRTLTAASPEAIYSQADQIADFGAPQGSVSVRVVQISATYGRGTARKAIV